MNWPEVLQVTAFCLAALFSVVVVIGVAGIVVVKMFEKFLGERP